MLARSQELLRLFACPIDLAAERPAKFAARSTERPATGARDSHGARRIRFAECAAGAGGLEDRRKAAAEAAGVRR
jgi:hypothetical protein